MKILMVIDDFIFAHGGSEQHLLFLLKKLPRSECEVHFAVLSGIRQADPSDFGVPPVILKREGDYGLRGAGKRLWRLASMIRSLDIDIVYAFCPVSELFAAAGVRLARRGRVLAARRNSGYWHTRATVLRARCMAKCGLHYLANCEAVRRSCQQRERIAEERISVILNPLHEDRRREGLAAVVPRGSVGIRDGEAVVGLVANIRRVKDHASLLRAVPRVLQQFPRTRFLLVGAEERGLAEELRALGRELKIDQQLTWTGAIRNPYTVIPHFDVGALSSASEGFPNTLVEYAAAGVPAVVADVGGAREIVMDGQTGFVVPPRSPEALADRICRLLGDRDLRRRMGECARRRVEAELAEDKILMQYVDLYHRLTARARP